MTAAVSKVHQGVREQDGARRAPLARLAAGDAVHLRPPPLAVQLAEKVDGSNPLIHRRDAEAN